MTAVKRNELQKINDERQGQSIDDLFTKNKVSKNFKTINKSKNKGQNDTRFNSHSNQAKSKGISDKSSIKCFHCDKLGQLKMNVIFGKNTISKRT